MRFAWMAVLAQTLGYPFLEATLCVLNAAALRRSTDDRLKRSTGDQRSIVARVQEIAIAGIAENKAVVGIIADKSLRNALYRFGKPLLAQPSSFLRPLQGGDVVKPAEPRGARKANMAAVISDLHVGEQSMERLSLLGPPHDFTIQNLAASLAQCGDDLLALSKVEPELFCVSSVDFLLTVS
jgi:hypothetical protein